LAALPTAIAYAALLGLGMHRHGGPWAVSAAATALAFGPPLAVATTSAREVRAWRLAMALAAWSLLLWIALPVYFPGERRQAVATGLALLGGDRLAQRVADGLPEESAIATPEVPMAATAEVDPLPAPTPLSSGDIALPYEGEGRRLSVPVVLQVGNRSHEVYMMLDTGATYTTLPRSVLREIGALPNDDSPVIRLHTANGQRDAQVALLDRIWLGDLPTDGVAIATCDPCAGKDTVGLLGLNVSGGFNMTIDADRREVIFSRRTSHNRSLDVKPFTELDAAFTRYPGGRVEVSVRFVNNASRPIAEAVASVGCGGQTWEVPVYDIAPNDEVATKRKLPEHEPCPQYEISLKSADW